MAGGIRRKKNNPSKKRDKRLGPIKYDSEGKMIDDRNTEVGAKLNYKDIIRESPSFEAYYRSLNMCSKEEADKMMAVMKSDLPASFRITGTRSQAAALLRIIESKYFSELTRAKESGGDVVVPTLLPWYPDRLAYQLNVTRKDIRRQEIYFRLHNFLVAETECGAISRQETVSMLPPLVLGVEPHHKVLDMCAAPGSKTAQLIEGLHSGPANQLPSGLVVANDSDNSRCYMLTHQAKRLQSPCLIITNHDASCLPNLQTSSGANMKFDRILADVPCTGDGTMRKNPDIWPKWNPKHSHNLHGLQHRIGKRGLELLAVGGRLVYSTCSLNPVENEAVVARLVAEAAGAVRVVEVSSKVEGLSYIPGLTSWQCTSKEGDLYSTWSEVPENLSTTLIRPEHFPTEDKEVLEQLKRCVRVLPHLQNTGGFFVALLEKVEALPWESKREKVFEGEEKENEKKEEPPTKKKRFWGFKEDPFIYCKEGDEAVEKIASYYGLDPQISYKNILTRCADETKKNNLYLTTEGVKEVIEANKERVKIINTGVKAFARCENKGATCDFRLAQEGVLSTVPFIGRSRRLHPTLKDLELLLSSDDANKPPEVEAMSNEFKEELNKMETGSVALVFSDPSSDLTVEVVGWKGKTSIRAYVPRNDRLHYLRLIGADTERFEKNKFQERQGREARRGERKERRDAEEGEKNGENGGQEGEKNGEETPAAENGDEPEK